MEARNKFYGREGASRPYSLRGMSGGGVWFVPKLFPVPFPPDMPFLNPKLMGSFIEHRKQQSVLVAPKITFHLQKIADKYPDLGKLLEAELEAHRQGEELQPWKKQ
jgi:hypothetical protein